MGHALDRCFPGPRRRVGVRGAPLLCLVLSLVGIRGVFPLNELASIRTLADESVGETEDAVLEFLTTVGHPALIMDPMF